MHHIYPVYVTIVQKISRTNKTRTFEGARHPLCMKHYSGSTSQHTTYAGQNIRLPMHTCCTNVYTTEKKKKGDLKTRGCFLHTRIRENDAYVGWGMCIPNEKAHTAKHTSKTHINENNISTHTWCTQNPCPETCTQALNTKEYHASLRSTKAVKHHHTSILCTTTTCILTQYVFSHDHLHGPYKPPASVNHIHTSYIETAPDSLLSPVCCGDVSSSPPFPPRLPAPTTPRSTAITSSIPGRCSAAPKHRFSSPATC